MEDTKKTNALIRYHIREILIRFIQHRRNDPEIKRIIEEIVKEAQQEASILNDVYS